VPKGYSGGLGSSLALLFGHFGSNNRICVPKKSFSNALECLTTPSNPFIIEFHTFDDDDYHPHLSKYSNLSEADQYDLMRDLERRGVFGDQDNE
jgi:hypothetical protein